MGNSLPTDVLRGSPTWGKGNECEASRSSKNTGEGWEELLILTWNGKYQSGNSNYQEFPELRFREITNSMPLYLRTNGMLLRELGKY